MPLQLTNIDAELTQRCNLNCSYCYLGQHRAAGTMSPETIGLLVDWVARSVVKRKPNEKPLKITFYGGEPLLAFPQMRAIVESCQAQNLRTQFTAVSNGTISAPEIVEFCKANKIGVQRSLDGCPETLDAGRGQKALEAYHRATPAWRDYQRTRRATIVPEAAHRLVESFEYFQSLGFPLGGSPIPNYYVPWSAEQVQAFIAQLWELGRRYVADYQATGRGFYLYWFERVIDSTLRQRHRRAMGCGAGRGLHAVTWDGYVMMCHRFCSEDRNGPYCAGHLRDVLAGTERGYGRQVQAEMRRAWNNQRPAWCQDCPGAMACNQGCYHVHVKQCDRILAQNPVFCAFQRAAAEIVDWIDQQLRPSHPKWFVKPAPAARKSPAKEAPAVSTTQTQPAPDTLWREDNPESSSSSSSPSSISSSSSSETSSESSSPSSSTEASETSESSSSQATEEIRVEIVDGVSGQVLHDPAGRELSYRINVDEVSEGDHDAHVWDFRLPRSAPDTCYLRIRVTGPLPSETVLYFDQVDLVEGQQLYAGGPFVAAFCGRKPPRVGDTWRMNVANAYNGRWQTWYERVFAMAAKDLRLPTEGQYLLAESLIA